MPLPRFNARRLAAGLASLYVIAAAPPASAEATGYCSPTGDYCHAAMKRGGVVRIMFDTFSFRGRIQVCVTGPEESPTCHRFRLRSRGSGLYGVRVRWSSHFPNEGRGTYRVRYRYGGSTLGPADRFRR